MTLSDGWPPFYAERRTAADINVGQLYVAFVVAALACAILLVLPGVRGLERAYFVLRWTVSLLTGALIVACGQGVSWQVADVTADFRYKVTSGNLTTFNVGLRIGLTQFNVTMKSEPSSSGIDLNLNEQFFFLSVDDMIEKALLSGAPFPILSIAEHFSNGRFHSLWPWGRRYWIAGHYGSYLLWTALACWIVTNVIFHMTLAHGSVFMILTGILLLSANLSFASLSSGKRLVITMGYSDPPSQLRVMYGWCFWVSMSLGLFCVFLGIVAYAMQKFRKKSMEKFFMIVNDEETVYSVRPSVSFSDDPPKNTKGGIDDLNENFFSPARNRRAVKRTLTGEDNAVFVEESNSVADDGRNGDTGLEH